MKSKSNRMVLLFALIVALLAMAGPGWAYENPVKAKDGGGVDATKGGHPGGFGSPDDILVFVNGDVVWFPDQKPYINEDSRTMVPVRFVAQEMGAAVDWNNDTETVTITRAGTTIKLTVGQSVADVNGVPKAFDTKAVLVNDRTMVPLRFISETFGARVDWIAPDPANCISAKVKITFGGGK